MNRTGIVIILCAMAVIGLVLFVNRKSEPQGVACTMDARMCPDGSYVGRIPPSCDFAACPRVIHNLNSAVYPLYNEMTWGTEASSTITLKDQILSGSQVSSEIIPSVTNIGEVASKFQAYYVEKLMGAGWVQNKNYAADGAGSSLWVYVKGNDYVVFSYSSEAINKATNAPLTCPCTMRFTIFTGSKK